MNIIIELIGIACFAVIFRTIVTPALPKFMWVKPLTCESCLGFWFAYSKFTFIDHISFILSLTLASISYFLAYKIYKL